MVSTVNTESFIMCSQKVVLGLVALLAFSAMISVSEACKAGGGGGAGGGRGGDAFHIRADRAADNDGEYHIYVNTDALYQPADYDAPGK